MKMMTWLKFKFALGISGAVVLAGGVVAVALPRNGATINPANGLPLAQTSQPDNPTDAAIPAQPEPAAAPATAAPADPSDLSATNLVRLTIQAYASLSTYRSVGWTVHWWGDDHWTNHFTEVLRREPRDHNVEVITAAHPFSYTNRWWSDQGTNYTQDLTRYVRLVSDKDGDLLLVFQDSLSPALFYNMNWGNILDTLKWSKSPELVRLPDEIVGTNSCYVLARTNAGITVWIDQQDLLIRRYQQISSPEDAAAAVKKASGQAVEPKSSGRIETYDDIVINETLPKEAFIPNLDH